MNVKPSLVSIGQDRNSSFTLPWFRALVTLTYGFSLKSLNLFLYIGLALVPTAQNTSPAISMTGLFFIDIFKELASDLVDISNLISSFQF